MSQTRELTTVSVKEKLKALYRLQIVHTKIDKIRIIRGELPLEIEDLSDEVAGLNTRMKKLNDEMETIKNDILSNKNSIIFSNESIAKYQEQLKNIKNNREYTSLTKEIEFQNLEIKLAEKRKTQNDANLLHKKEIINACAEQISEKEHELKIKKAELDEIIKDTEKEEKALIKDSKKAEKVIDERLLNAYYRIRSKVSDGRAVVSLERGACGGCYSEIPPQRQLDIKMHKKIIICEHCGRIMIDKDILEEA